MLLETDPPMAADVDGEVRLRTPIRLRVVPNGVRVMVPAEFEDR
jgi:diacylglycerol kinase family enzyme